MMTDERFFEWLDGELDAAAATEVAAAVAADPELQRKADAHRAMQARLRGAFDAITPAPATDNVVDLAQARSRFEARRALPSMAQWAAIAATLVVGMVTGTMVGTGAETTIRTDSGQLIASGDLDRALDRRLASAPVETGPRIGLTFRDKAGSICRSFSDGAAHGLACRDDEAWAVRGLIQGADAGRGDFRMAAGADPGLAAMIDSQIAGEPFDAEAERKALDGGWR